MALNKEVSGISVLSGPRFFIYLNMNTVSYNMNTMTSEVIVARRKQVIIVIVITNTDTKNNVML